MSAEGLVFRRLTPADRAALAELPRRVSPESTIMRFHAALTSLSESLLDRLLDLEDGQREAVVAWDGDDIVGVARFVRDSSDADTAELAVLVADDWQHHGVGHGMIEPLIVSALSAGIRRFRGDMLANNAAARAFLLGLGPLVAQEYVEGHVVMTVGLGD